ncbi:MAG: histidinol phosphate phosphatase, partial [Solirubrobacterales bacterium]
MLTDYHVHLRPDDITASPDDYFTPAQIEKYLKAAESAGIGDLGCAEHMYRFTEALTVWSHPFWEEWAINDLDQYCETVAGSPAKLGIEADYVLGAEDRLDNMLSPRPFEYIIGSVHFIGEKSMDT